MKAKSSKKALELVAESCWAQTGDDVKLIPHMVEAFARHFDILLARQDAAWGMISQLHPAGYEVAGCEWDRLSEKCFHNRTHVPYRD